MFSESTPPAMPSLPVLFLALLFSYMLAPHSFAEGNGTTQAVTDDLHYRGLANSLEKSLSYFETAATETFNLCGHSMTGHEISSAYKEALSILTEKNENDDLALFFSENFTTCSPTSLLVTGYYTPIFSGSLAPSSTYRYPLYAPPKQDTLRCNSRAEINDHQTLKGHEIAYLADPLDLFFLHVQGSGIIELPDGRRLLASYAADNGRPYTSIGKVLINEGILTREEVSLASIRKYLTENPDQRKRILHCNERFIFFRLSTPEPNEFVPSGSLGFPLTPGRSVAMDDRHYPPGILGVLTSSQPVLNKKGDLLWQKFTRLVTHQDSGAAIAGAHRLDLYMGIGSEAGRKAGLMKEKGTFMILIPNLSFQPDRSKIVASETIGTHPKKMDH